MSKEVVLVQSKFIEPGIKKYEGVIDAELQALIDHAGYEYKSYVFNDGRILLVLPNEISALLYASRDILFKKLQLV